VHFLAASEVTMIDYTKKVREFIATNFLFEADQEGLDGVESLLESGIVDSTGVLEIVAWVEESFGFRVPDEDLLPENFDSVQRLAGYLARSMAGAQPLVQPAL
jgi:acyl carrier protein